MQKITRNAINKLIRHDGGMVLSLYIPTHRHSSPADIQEDKIRYKNLVQRGIGQWRPHVGREAARTIKNQLDTYLHDADFWRQTTQGLAVFASADALQMYHMPIECEERVHVGGQYDVTPLLIADELNQPFYVFALAQHNPKLFVGDLYDVRPSGVDFPNNAQEALGIDELHANSNTIRAFSAIGVNPSATHGQGDVSDAGHEERLAYYRMLDKVLCEHVHIDQSVPVLLAGAEHEAGDFRALSRLKTLLPTFLRGNHTATPLAELHKLSAEIVRREVVESKLRTIMEQYQSQLGVQRASSNEYAIRRATSEGRVDILMIGMLDATADGVSEARPADSLLIRNLDTRPVTVASLVRSVLNHGGRVVALTRDQMPEHVQVSATYRY